MEELAGKVLEDGDVEGIIRYDAEYHIWVHVVEDTATIGITDYAQRELNEVTYVELPEPETGMRKGDFLGTVEALKTNVDLLAPVSGTVTEVNEALVEQPELVNSSPYEKGWLARIRMGDTSEVEALVTGAVYRERLVK